MGGLIIDVRGWGGCYGDLSFFSGAIFGSPPLFDVLFPGPPCSISHNYRQHIFFSHYNLFLGKFKEKLARKACVNIDASASDCAHAPWASHNTP